MTNQEEKVVLTDQEYALGCRIGSVRNQRAIERGATHADGRPSGVDPEDERNNQIGALGELAVAKYLGSTWNALGKGVDVGSNIEVRTTSHRDWGMVVPSERLDKAPNAIWVLVRRAGRKTYYIVGWLPAEEVRKVAVMAQLKGGRKRAPRVEVRFLRPPAELLSQRSGAARSAPASRSQGPLASAQPAPGA